jgi:predicted RNA binding protein YcfA (HicA-like mRNA interferase family)
MPKLPTRSGKQLVKILQLHGFTVDHVTGSHHILINESKTRRVTVPVHTKDLPKGTLHEIMKQAGLSSEDL